MSEKKCAYCGKGNDSRPYGRDMAMICYECAMKPENIAETQRQFTAQLNAAGHGGKIVLIGESTGPRPFPTEEPRS